MKYYLGVDGGGTKTEFLLGDENGSILAKYTGGSCHYLQIGYEGITDLIAAGLHEICTESGVSRNRISGAFLGLAGYGDIASHAKAIEEAVAKSMKYIPFSLGNDCENALAGALGGRSGINIIAGTGSVGFGRDDSGRTCRCGGWHYALGGDEGSAYWIGWSLLKEFSRQRDGRSPETELRNTIKNHLNVDSDDEVVNRVAVEWNLDREKIAALSPLCTELAGNGDPAAVKIMKDCARELADYAEAIYRKLDFTGETPVSGTGGVFSSGKVLTDELDRLLRKKGMYYTAPAADPATGALILAGKGNITVSFPDR